MEQFLTETIRNLPEELKYISVFIISMIPIVELRLAIPIAATVGLPAYIALPIAIVGNLIPIPFIIIFIRRIFAWMRKVSPKLNKVVDKMEAKADKNKDKILKYAFWGLALFVGIPLPGTGAWTGALIANALKMPIKKSLPSICLGVLCAAIIMSIVSYFIPGLFGF